MARALPLDPAMFAPEQAYHHEFSETELGSGLVVRRIIFKTPLFRFVTGRIGPRPPRPPVDTEPRPMPSEPPRNQALYVQCAFDLSRLRAEIAGFAERRDRELADLDIQTAETLTALRNRF